MALSVTYGQRENFLVRFADNFRFATKADLGNRKAGAEANLLEKIGNWGLWTVEGLPRKVKAFVTEPRVVTFALTVFALIAVSYAFYRGETTKVIRAGLDCIAKIPYSKVKFVAYLTIVETAVSYHNRAQGRFWNDKLKDQFWNNR